MTTLPQLPLPMTLLVLCSSPTPTSPGYPASLASVNDPHLCSSDLMVTPGLGDLQSLGFALLLWERILSSRRKPGAGQRSELSNTAVPAMGSYCRGNGIHDLITFICTHKFWAEINLNLPRFRTKAVTTRTVFVYPPGFMPASPQRWAAQGTQKSCVLSVTTDFHLIT